MLSFRYAAKWFSYTFFSDFFSLFEGVGYGSLCYTVGPCWLSIWYIVFCISWKLLIYPSPTPFPLWWPYDCFLCLWLYFCFINQFICVIIFRFHINVLSYDICLHLAYFTYYDNPWVHPHFCKWHCFIPFNGLVILHIYSICIYHIFLSIPLLMDI